MRAATAYFVGAGTIITAIAIGLGGGLVAGNIMNPVSPKKSSEAAKVERRAEPVAATNAPSAQVKYLAGSQVFGGAPAASTQSDAGKTALASPAPTQPAKTTAAQTTPAQTTPAIDAKIADRPAAPQAQPADQQAAKQPAGAPDDAYARAKDSDVKRAASERRRAERRQHWAERRHYEQRDRSDARDRPDWNRDRADWNRDRMDRDRTDWGDVGRNVREDYQSRELASRPRWGAPQIPLFGADDD